MNWRKYCLYACAPLYIRTHLFWLFDLDAVITRSAAGNRSICARQNIYLNIDLTTHDIRRRSASTRRRRGWDDRTELHHTEPPTVHNLAMNTKAAVRNPLSILVNQ